MKREFKNLLIVLLGAFCLQSFMPGPGKCKGDAEYKMGVKKLGNFRLIKDYRISLAGGKEKDPPTISFPISLTSGLKYKFIAENNADNKSKMIMKIYMNAKKEMMVATTYNSSSKKHYPTIEFECRTSGTFYLFFSFEGGLKGCGVGLFSVSK